ncbi:MAG TPA: SpoIID/LytB domain-containing protein [Pyrinomonadaceae bacterium]|jgi:stage II sporulation protein D|nr:SpoIID/LytB domain-containing protein [Pyrinomonadaceae bacterium]
MRSSVQRIFAATLLACLLVSSSFKLSAQDSRQTVTRPRRATASEWPTTTPDDPVNAEVEAEPARLKGEPVVRIGLAVDARSVTVSTTGHLLNETEPGTQPAPFEVARVRIEPRTLQPLPSAPPDGSNNDSEVETTAASTRKDMPGGSIDSSAGRRAASAGEPAAAQQTRAATRQTERASAPATPGATSRVTSGTKDTSAGAKASVQLTSRASAPVRGEALYVPGTTRPLLDARAPVLLASDDEEQHPIRYNEKAYRGRLEVFANTRGTLTVVNVVPLEDYVRGVVPNELSPGGWPELEALKAQAVAARTYAVSNLGRFGSEGFDLTPDTRSQVYGGRSTEHTLTDRAVFETRGRIATYKGVPINALYTSTCGGRTEDAENIFGGPPVPYLRGRECALESREHFAPFNVRTTRELPSVKLAEHATAPRDAALLAAHGFNLPARLSDEWLAGSAAIEELRELLGRVAALARQPTPNVTADVTRPGGFATALAASLDGESRGATLLNSADVQYLLAFRDAEDVPQQNRADVAAMLRDGHLALFPDGTLRPRQPISRARALHSIAHALEARGLLRLQKATTRPSAKDSLLLRPPSSRSDLSMKVAPEAFLFSAFGEGLFPVREINFVGGEAVTYHTDARGEIDYLEARPSANGAATDHYSPFANWKETLTPVEVMSRLSRSAPNIGSLVDLRVLRRGVSGRVLDLEVIGTATTAHVRGGRIRSALGLREQLFVIDRTYDDEGRVARFTFTGRGWGHGVGMCQVGAYGLARAGLPYDKILKSFYTGISVTKLY